MKLISLDMLKKLFYFSIAVKLFVSIFISIEGTSEGPSPMFFHFYRMINNDEKMSAHVAFNYNSRQGFTDSVSTFNFGPRRLKLTAYRPTFPIVLHILYQKVYEKFYLLRAAEINDLNSLYYNIYALLIHYSSLLLFLLSIPFFKNLASRISTKENIQYGVTIIYVLNPASLYYIGLYPLYENIVLPLFVIGISKLVDILYNDKQWKKTNYLIVPICITLGCLLRPHVLISAALVVAYLLLLVFLHFKRTRKYSAVAPITLLVIIFMAMTHGLIVYKNYKRIGKAVLSTEASQAFYFGHNPYTRGSWAGDAEGGSATEQFLRKNIPGLDSMSEAQLDSEHKRVTWQWIKENPAKEAELLIRKTALYLLPYNYCYLHFNILTFIINVGFVGFCVMFLFNLKNRKFYSYELVFSMLIIIGSVLMTYYAFFEYRYTYYAQPFMMLLAAFFYPNVRWPKQLQNKVDFPVY
jgi:hypothetical protein